MNYIKQINAFWEWLTFHNLTDTEVRTYLGLLHCANKLYWASASIPNKAIMHYAGIDSKMQLGRVRNKLETEGLIEYTPGDKNHAGTYNIVPLYKDDTDINTQNVTQNDTKTVTQSVTESDTKSDTQNDTINKHKNIKHKTKNNSDILAKFATFWEEYPRKVSKQNALKAWNKLCPDDSTVDAIMHGLDKAKHCEQWCRDNGQFIPHAATWLNGRRWEDDYEINVTEIVTDTDTHMSPTEGVDEIEKAFMAAYCR